MPFGDVIGVLGGGVVDGMLGGYTNNITEVYNKRNRIIQFSTLMRVVFIHPIPSCSGHLCPRPRLWHLGQAGTFPRRHPSSAPRFAEHQPGLFASLDGNPPPAPGVFGEDRL